MAKKSAGKSKHSAKTGSSASTANAAETAVPTPKAEPKKPDFSCQYCNKIMRDVRMKKLHERNCKSKAAPEKKLEKNPLESAILELKDRFQDEVVSMSRTIQEREEQHRKEMDEVKTVLRMEIDHHRRELERMAKAEKDAASEKPPAQTAPQPTPAEEPIRPSPRTPDSRPRAIDMIPLPVPTVPRRKYQPLPEDESIPEIDGEGITQAPERHAPGFSREEIESLIRETINGTVSRPPDVPGASAEEFGRLSARMDQLDLKLERGMAELRKAMDRSNRDIDIKRFEKDLEKVSERVTDIMEDSGYGESLSVMKIPPTILEIVYQAILDDIQIEIMRTKGAQDAERVARSALEEVRLKTSGSELFKFDGRKIVTDSLARSIESNMISAKQIQTTYDVLLEKLLETVPHHKAKNFKGMIKVKSQEFAVDRATKLTKEFAKMEKIVESTSQMIAAMSANFNTRNMELHEMLKEMKDTTMATKADRDEIELLKTKMNESTERAIRMADDLALLRAELEMKRDLASREVPQPAEDSGMVMAPGEMPPSADAPAEPQPSENLGKVLGAISKGLGSKSSIMAETGLDDTAIAECLDTLVNQKKIIAKKVGKRTKYTTLERELGEKLKADDSAKGRKQSEDKGGPWNAEKWEMKPAEVLFDAPEQKSEEISQPEPVTGEEPAGESPKQKAPEKKSTKGKKSKAASEKPEPPKKGKKAKPEPRPEPADTQPKTDWTVAPEEPKPAADVQQEVLPEPEQKHRRDAPANTAEPPPSETEPQTEDAHAVMDELPVVKKSLEELTEDERHVMEAVSEEGMTVSGIQSKVGKHIKRFALLRALRVLIDSGHVGILTKGRLELYHKINVPKSEKTDKEKNMKEVK